MPSPPLLDASTFAGHEGRCIHPGRTRGSVCGEPVASNGEEFCLAHLPSTAQAREITLRKLIKLQDKAIQTLEDIFAGAEDKVRLQAVITVLDRTGLGPKSTVEVADLPEDLSQLTQEQLAERAERTAERLRQLATTRRAAVLSIHRPPPDEAVNE